VQRGGGHRHPLGEAAGPVHAEQAALAADLREPASAQVAPAAAEQRVDRHAATGRVDAGDLVAHHQWRLAHPEAAKAVQLAAADARSLDVQDHLAVARLRLVDVLHLDHAGSREDQSSHTPPRSPKGTHRDSSSSPRPRR